MLSWLKTVRSMLQQCTGSPAPVTIVLGNMACDLDSGVSSLVLAYHRANSSQRMVLPVLNIPRQDYPLKTELVEALSSEGIQEQDLVFRDELDFDKIGDLQLILVDHNVLADHDQMFEDKVVEVIDHHVKETQCSNSIIEMVGSCSSLVLRQILKENPNFGDLTCIKLVLSTILIDTVLLQPEAKKVTDVDIEVAARCEEMLGSVNREKIFTKLDAAKKKVDHLNAKQLLRRDYKTFKTKDLKNVCLSSLPLLARDWSKLDDVLAHVETFMADGEFGLLLVLGSFFGTSKSRDIIVIGDQQSDIYRTVISALETSREPNLELTKMTDIAFEGFAQGNIGASRKQIMPIVKNVLT